ncbi:MAG TPA: hypothetical protein VES88_09545 [Gemmatimonadaceae bacterium]|nr:hypothetical protein [Gemmatimonadaceae bacterium]
MADHRRDYGRIFPGQFTSEVRKETALVTSVSYLFLGITLVRRARAMTTSLDSAPVSGQ